MMGMNSLQKFFLRHFVAMLQDLLIFKLLYVANRVANDGNSAVLMAIGIYDSELSG